MSPALHRLPLALGAGGLALALLTAAQVSAAPATAGPTVSFLAPDATGSPASGSVLFRGSAGADLQHQQTTVIFAVDVSNSTSSVQHEDCNGDGVRDDRDDLNADHSVGDILDCEIGAVLALNQDLARVDPAVANVRVGLAAFGETAATASTGTDGAVFVDPSDASAEARPRIEVVAQSLHRHEIGQYTPRTVRGGTSFAAATSTALAALDQVQGGQKWIMLLSDGLAPSPPPAQVAALRASGVHLRAFAVGNDSSCRPGSSLAALALATGERCLPVLSPSGLSSRIVDAQPAAVSRVVVSIGPRQVVADVDPIGTWSARMGLIPGRYTATATATSTSGRTTSTERTFTVTAQASGGGGTPAPGGSAADGLPRTTLRIAVPAATVKRLPSRATGSVTVLDAGRRSPGTGLSVRLEYRLSVPGRWRTAARAVVARTGFVLSTSAVPGTVRGLRVVLPAQAGLPAATAAVPTPVVSACSVTARRARGSSVRYLYICRTTAPSTAAVVLSDRGRLVGRGAVSRGRLQVVALRRVAHPTLRVVVGRRTAASVTF